MQPNQRAEAVRAALSECYEQLQQVIDTEPADGAKSAEIIELRAFEQGQVDALRQVLDLVPEVQKVEGFLSLCEGVLEDTAQYVAAGQEVTHG